MKSREHLGVYIKTYGCQMNVYDSEMISEILKPIGYRTVTDISDAEVVVLNTCNIREKAAEKMYSDLGRIRDIGNLLGRKLITVVAGCVAQAEGEVILERAKNVDLIVGPQSINSLPEMIGKIKRDFKKEVCLDFPTNTKFDTLPEESLIKTGDVSAFVSVQEGCDKFCHFCCVPYTRGAEYSRDVNDVIAEVSRLVASGVKEITLLGQNVTAYHGKINGEEKSLGNLIEMISEIPEIVRIRYTTSHPVDMHSELYNAHKIKKVVPFKHLPIQSGSDRILQSMNRKHTVDQYIEVFNKMKQIRPEFEFSSDFIVGYPGETEEDFNKTLEIVDYIAYPQAYSFKYSPRPGTPAAGRKDQISEDVKAKRLTKLQNLLNEKRLSFNKSMEEKTVEVLFNGKNAKRMQLHGKTDFLQSVYVNDPEYKCYGKIQKVKIVKAHTSHLEGEICSA